MGSHADKNRPLIGIAALSLGVGVSVAHAAPGDIYNLGSLGGDDSQGLAINASGQVAGNSRTGASDPFGVVTHAFVYTGTPGSGGVMHDLGTLGGRQSYAYALNAAGQVAGKSNTTGNVAERAFLYTGTPGSGGAMVDLGTLGGTYSEGRAINASGHVTGVSGMLGDLAGHAFRYTGTPGSGGAMADLGTLGGPRSTGLSINASGQVTGWADWTSGFRDLIYHPFLYTGTPGSGGIMHDLGTFGGPSPGRVAPGVGVAINDSGQVTGWSEIAGTDRAHAFLYTGTPGSGGVMHDLGTLFGGNSGGLAINAAGHVAGASDGRAFLYTGTPGVDGLMINLDTWLDANNPSEGAKWMWLSAATGLSDNGLITGSGYYDDGPGGLSDGARAFLLDVSSLIPEPGGLALLGLAVPVMLRRRARRTKKKGR